jgi:chemotaxis protein CheZ
MAMPVLDEDVEQRLHNLSKSMGPVDPKDILEVVQSVMASIEGDRASLSQRLHTDIEALAEYINSAKTEISEIGADKINSEYLPEASDQLNAIVGATEQATNDIFEAVESIEELTPAMTPEQAEQVSQAVTRVYESLQFSGHYRAADYQDRGRVAEYRIPGRRAAPGVRRRRRRHNDRCRDRC